MDGDGPMDDDECTEKRDKACRHLWTHRCDETKGVGWCVGVGMGGCELDR